MKTNARDTKSSRRGRRLLYLLLGLEIVLGFALGLFSGELNELISLGVEAVLVGIVVLMLLSFLVAVATIRYDSGEPIVPTIPLAAYSRFMANEFTTVFPVSAIVGIVIGFVSVHVFPGKALYVGSGSIPAWDYEIAGYIASLAILGLIQTRTRKRRIVFGFAIGYAFGLPLSVLLMRPFENEPLTTFAGWLVGSFLTALFITSRLFQTITMHIQEIFKPAEKDSTNAG